MEQESASSLRLAMDKAADLALAPKDLSEDLSTGLSSPAEPRADAADNNEIFTKLVSGDDDIIGLVAYSLYKQNKIDWMRAFESRYGRAPNEMEFAAYIVGENTPRRVATYRFLAESTVNRSGVSSSAPSSSPVAKFGEISKRPLLSATMNVFYGLVGVGLVAALIVLLRFVFSLRHAAGA